MQMCVLLAVMIVFLQAKRAQHVVHVTVLSLYAALLCCLLPCSPLASCYVTWERTLHEATFMFPSVVVATSRK